VDRSGEVSVDGSAYKWAPYATRLISVAQRSSSMLAREKVAGSTPVSRSAEISKS
jgi:hypothetical protein